MKGLRNALVITAVALALTIAQPARAGAYQLVWTSIQHRVFESAGPQNRLSFEITDDSGNYVSSAGAVAGVVLKDPTGKTVSLSTVAPGDVYQYYSARFYPNTSAFAYADPVLLCDFGGVIRDPLVIGIYTLEVSMQNGQKLTGQIAFNYLVDIPVVPSRSFRIHTDASGNLHWTWDIPDELLELAKTLSLEIRAGVFSIANGGTNALYWPNIPVEMGYSFAPAFIYQNLLGSADEIQFSFQVRTVNNNGRAYSNAISVKDLSSPVAIVPGKKVVVVPLN